MANRREPARSRQQNSDPADEVFVVTTGPIRIRRGELFLGEEIRAALRIGKDTLQKWMDDGLPCAQPWTKSQVFNGDDVIDFMARHAKSRSV